jgi:hypothetical protein
MEAAWKRLSVQPTHLRRTVGESLAVVLMSSRSLESCTAFVDYESQAFGLVEDDHWRVL